MGEAGQRKEIVDDWSCESTVCDRVMCGSLRVCVCVRVCACACACERVVFDKITCVCVCVSVNG